MTISPDQKPISSGFGMHTPAADIVANIDLTGKKAIVTGGYSGIGLETTKALASVGAKVIVPVRSKEKAAAALSDVEGDVTSAPMDLGDLNSVKTFANDFLGVHQKLDILINNAGVMACPETRVGPNWEAQIATNHFGHFALFQHLSPALEAANGARVVALSSTAHKISPIRFDDMHFTQDDYNKWVAYGQSKTADALFAIGVDARLKEKGVRAFAVHPGGILTPLAAPPSQRRNDRPRLAGRKWRARRASEGYVQITGGRRGHKRLVRRQPPIGRRRRRLLRRLRHCESERRR